MKPSRKLVAQSAQWVADIFLPVISAKVFLHPVLTPVVASPCEATFLPFSACFTGLPP